MSTNDPIMKRRDRLFGPGLNLTEVERFEFAINRFTQENPDFEIDAIHLR